MRILIAEDEAVSRRLLESALTGWGYDVIAVCDGVEAYEMLQSRDAPELAILDWMMPGMNGLDVCRRVREQSSARLVYIIMLTGRGKSEDIVAGLQAGADDYVTKPFACEELRARIQVGLRILDLNRMSSELISLVSHELRSPLTSILNALSLVASGDAGEIPPPAKRMVDIAHRNSERLLRLINDMLDLKKIEIGKMEFHLQDSELAPLIKQAIEANRAYADQLKVGFILEDKAPGVKVNVDIDRLMQVLTSLFTNAARFSPPNDSVVVSISHNDDMVRVSVSDHGPGIPEDFRDRLFQKFAQAKSPGARRKGGTGLGLSIAKAIVESMGGLIYFETETDVGTTFYFDLPEYHETLVPCG